MKFYIPSEYQQRCLETYKEYRKLLGSLLPHAKIEHIGSSAVPGALSKGDLDIFLGVKLEQHSEAVVILEKAGFCIKVGTLRTTELCMLEAPEQDVAVQVVAIGSEYEFFVEFRNMLLKSKDLLNSYNELKRQSESLEDNEYRNIKSEFIENALGNAKLGAAAENRRLNPCAAILVSRCKALVSEALCEIYEIFRHYK